jgi:uncharacterized damage-inducible protein DinB
MKRISDLFMAELDHEMALTRKTIERVPDDKFHYKPHEKSMEMGALALHIAMMTGWGADTLKNDSFDIAPVDGPKYEMPTANNRAELLAVFDQNVSALRAALASTEDEAMMKQWSLLNGGTPIFTMPRGAVMRSMIFNHLVHHRGQLTVYLRMNNVAVPAIYGPSADEMN